MFVWLFLLLPFLMVSVSLTSNSPVLPSSLVWFPVVLTWLPAPRRWLDHGLRIAAVILALLASGAARRVSVELGCLAAVLASTGAFLLARVRSIPHLG